MKMEHYDTTIVFLAIVVITAILFYRALQHEQPVIEQHEQSHIGRLK